MAIAALLVGIRAAFSREKERPSDFEEAKQLRAEGSEWQKDAIDEVESLLRGMADHLSATLAHLNKNQSRMKLQPWIDHVKSNRQYANTAATLIRGLRTGQGQVGSFRKEASTSDNSGPGVNKELGAATVAKSIKNPILDGRAKRFQPPSPSLERRQYWSGA